MIKSWMAAGLLAIVCLSVYWPHQNAAFVLDDHYTVVHDPLIKNPALYPQIWSSRLFDASRSSGYIKFGYYRPVLQSSWILDYRLFALKAQGYQWGNLLVHWLNSFLIYILLWKLFGQDSLALKASLLFCVLPTQEWVVRYITGRGDELSALFALAALLTWYWVFKSRFKGGYFIVLIFWALAALTREVSISYVLFAFLIYFFIRYQGEDAGAWVNRFSFYWVLIGILPLLLIGQIIPKQGNILAWHTFYFASIGLCLWMAQLRSRWVVLFFVLFSSISFYQGQFWTTEETLLRHTRSLEFWPRTVVDQQLLMKYDDDIPAIRDMIARSHEPLIKAMWLRRLGKVYFDHADLTRAQQYFVQALSIDPADVDALNAMAVVCLQSGHEREGLGFLQHALEIKPSYPDTLKTLGLYFYLHKNASQARLFLTRCLFFDPDNVQAQELLRLANTMN